MSSNDNQEFYTLNAVAWAVCRDMQAGEERFEFILHHALEGWRELALNVAHQVEVKEIEMKPWKQIDFPCGLVDWVKIGFKKGDFLKILVNDPNIPKIFDKVNGVPQENKTVYPSLTEAPYSSDLIGFYDPYGLLGSGQFYGHAVPYNYLGYFDVDWKRKVFNFKETISSDTKVYLEFITDGINACGATVVTPYAFQTLKAWCHWMRKKEDSRFSIAERRESERMYKESLQQLAVNMLEISIDDIRDALLYRYKGSPKQ